MKFCTSQGPRVLIFFKIFHDLIRFSTIFFQGAHEEHPAKFQGFMMVAEPSPGNMAIQSPTSLGTFQLLPGDAMTKFSHKCSHSVEATSSMNKEHITVSRNFHISLLVC